MHRGGGPSMNFEGSQMMEGHAAVLCNAHGFQENPKNAFLSPQT